LKNEKDKRKKIFGWLGAVILLLIIPIKLFRILQIGYIANLIIGIAPSVLGPVGLLFLLLSSNVKYLSQSIFRATVIVLLIALGLEFAQLLPRPGFLQYVHYTFDWLDVISSFLSVVIGFIAANIITRHIR